MSRFDFGLANSARNKHTSFRKRKVTTGVSARPPISPIVPTLCPPPAKSPETVTILSQTSKKTSFPSVLPLPPLPSLPPVPPTGINRRLATHSTANTDTTPAPINDTGIRRRMTGSATNTNTGTIHDASTGTRAGKRVGDSRRTDIIATSTAALMQTPQRPQRSLSTYHTHALGGNGCAGMDDDSPAPCTPFYTPAARAHAHAQARATADTQDREAGARLSAFVHNIPANTVPGRRHTSSPNQPLSHSSQASALPEPQSTSPSPPPPQIPPHIIGTQVKPIKKTLKPQQAREVMAPPKHHFPRSKAPLANIKQSPAPPRITAGYGRQRLSAAASATAVKQRETLPTPPSSLPLSRPSLHAKKPWEKTPVVSARKCAQVPPRQANIAAQASPAPKLIVTSRAQMKSPSSRPHADLTLQGQAVHIEAPQPPQVPKARNRGWFSHAAIDARAHTSAATATAHAGETTAATHSAANTAYTTASAIMTYRAAITAYLAATSGKLVGNADGGRYIFPRFRGLRHRHMYGLASQRQVANLRLHARKAQRDQCTCGALREENEEGSMGEKNAQEGCEGTGSTRSNNNADEVAPEREKSCSNKGGSEIGNATVGVAIGAEVCGRARANVPRPTRREQLVCHDATRADTTPPLDGGGKEELRRRDVEKEEKEDKEKRKRGDCVVIDIGDMYLEDNHSNATLGSSHSADYIADPTLAPHTGMGTSVGVEYVFDGEGRIPDALSDDSDTEPHTFSADRLEAVKLQLMQRQRQRKLGEMIEMRAENGKDERHVPGIPENSGKSPYSQSSFPLGLYSPSISSRTAAELFLPPSPISANKLKKNSAEEFLEAEHAITSPHHSTLTAAYRSDWRCSRCAQQRPAQSAGWRMMVHQQGVMQTWQGRGQGNGTPRMDVSGDPSGATVQHGNDPVGTQNRQSGYKYADVQDEITQKHEYAKNTFFSILRAELREIYAPQLFIVRVTLVLWVLSVCVPLLTLLTRASGALLQDDDSYAVIVGKFVLRSHK